MYSCTFQTMRRMTEWRGGTISTSQPLDQSLVMAVTCGDTLSPGWPTSIHSLSMLESRSEQCAWPALTSLLNVNGILLEQHCVAESCHRLDMTHWYVWVFLWCLCTLMTVDRWEDLLNLPNELQLTCTVIVSFINLVTQY